MKPLYLSIQGINSFCEKQEVFFERLMESGLFCICGPTGSGKTTILDSIVLALYGKGGRGRLSDYINLSCSFAEIIFEFESESSVYRVERIFYKDSNKPSKCLFTDKTSGKVLADTVSVADQKLKGIIGLPREEFTQVALIEQGKFSEFLSADKASRNATVGNLFRLDKFKNLYEKFNSKKSAISAIAETLGEQCKEYENATEEHITLSRQAVEKLKSEIKNIDSLLKECSGEIEKQRALKLQWNNIIEAKQKLAAAESRFEILIQEITLLEKKLKDIDAYANESAARKETAEKNRQLLGALDGLKHTYSLKKSADEKRDTLTARLDKYNVATKENNKKLEIYKEKASFLSEKAAKDLNEVQKIYNFDINDIYTHLNMFSYDKQEVAATSEVQKERTFLNGTVISELRQKIHNIQSSREKIIAEIAAERESLAKTEKELNLQKGIWTESTAESNRLKAETEKLEAEVAVLRAKLKAAQVHDSASYVRRSLAAGDTCPVCGSAVTGDYADGDTDKAETAEKELSAAEAALENRRKTAVKVESVLSAACTKIDGCEEQITRQKRILETAENSLNELLKDVKDTHRLQELTVLLDNITAGLVELDKVSGLAKDSRAEGNTLKANISSVNDDILRTEKEIKDMLVAIEEKTGGEDLFSMQKRIETKIAEDTSYVARFEKSRQETETAIREKNNVKAGISGELKSIKEISEKDIIFDAEGFGLLEKNKENLEKNKAILTEECIKGEYEIKDTVSKLEKKKKLESQIKQLTDKTDKLALILKIIKGDRFLEYVAEEYILRFTCAASDILAKISSGKYTMEYQDGVFYVRDFLMAGELRRVSTLSGGETFLASLSLAMAITAEISGYKSFEFFFLDEGFGTLDSASIETVYEAIESLSKETLVGIVTHRSELVDKIQSRIILEAANEKTGSKIIHSY